MMGRFEREKRELVKPSREDQNRTTFCSRSIEIVQFSSSRFLSPLPFSFDSTSTAPPLSPTFSLSLTKNHFLHPSDTFDLNFRLQLPPLSLDTRLDQSVAYILSGLTFSNTTNSERRRRRKYQLSIIHLPQGFPFLPLQPKLYLASS